MGLFPSILSTLGTLASAYASNKLAEKQKKSSQEYQNAMIGANKSIGEQNASVDRQQQLADQYTGNQGYKNSLEQARQGASLIANQAVGQGISGARSAGMSKAQAAALGNQMANKTYADAFTGQQGNAISMGQNAITAQQGVTSGRQGVTSAQQGMAGLGQSETQNRYGRATDTMERGTNAAANAIGTLGNALV